MVILQQLCLKLMNLPANSLFLRQTDLKKKRKWRVGMIPLTRKLKRIPLPKNQQQDPHMCQKLKRERVCQLE